MPVQSGGANQRIRGQRGHRSKHVNWTDETDNHLWKTYTLYRHDPTVTPFFVQPGGVPPLGVCCRVAREAKRSWRGQKLLLGSIEEVGGTLKDFHGKQILRDVQDEANAVRTADSPDTVTGIKSGSSTPTASSEPQKLASKWPGTESATRRRLRKRSTAVRASWIRCPYMLSLMSSSTPSPTGTRSRVNCVIVWRTPSS